MSINAQPFQPQFKLIGNLAEDQVLVYDTSEGAFVNSAGSGGGGASGFTAIENVGATGTTIHYGEAGSTLQLKKLIGGDNLTITDNGTGGLILAATNTDTIQDGTNLGTGTGIFDSKDGTTHTLKFKSLAVGAGLTLTDDGAGTLTLVNTIAAGTTDADLTLSNLSDVATARTNLDVFSKAEGDARYHDKFSNFLPSANNVYDVGSPSFKFNDIYAETFQGTAVLAEQLTITGTTGQVLTYNGSEWAAADPTGSTLEALSNVSNVAPADNQHLVWDAGTSLWTPASAGEGMGGGGYGDANARGAISVSGDLSYNSTTGVISFTQNDAWSNITGTPTTLAGYGITDAFDGAYGSLTGTPTIPTAVSQLTNDSSFLTSVPAQTFASITGKPTTLAGYGITDGGSSYTNSDVDTHLNVSSATANQVLKWTGTDYEWVTSTDSDTTYTAGSGLTLVGTEFSLTGGTVTASSATAFTNKTGNISQWTNDAGYLTSETDSQTLSLSGTTLAITGGNNVDLGVLTIDDFADVNITSVSDGQFLTYDNGLGEWTNSTVSIPTLTSQLTNDAGFITSASTYDNSDVDAHLNQSNPTSGYVLSWNGSDYSWVAQTGGSSYGDADARAALSATTGLSYNSGTGVFSLNAQLENLSDVSSTTPNTGEVLKWNGSTWTPSADENDDTIYTTFNTDFDTRLATKSTTNVSEGTNKYFTDDRARQAISASGSLSYNAATGVMSYTAPTMYDNSDVDTHLNQGSATTGQILSWNGSDYDWIANAGTPAWSSITSKPTTIAGFGITDAFDGAYSSLTGAPTIPTNNNQLTNGAGYLTSVPAQSFASLTGKPTTIAGYGITDAVTASSATAFTNKTGAISQWSNDSGYLVSGDLSGYALTSSLSTVATTGNYSDLSGTPTMYANSDVDSHLNQHNPTSGYVLSWNGSDYAWVAQSGGGGGATDKIEEGNSSVEVIDGGANGHIMFNTNGTDRWQVSNSGHILPESNDAFDIGSASKKVRDLYLGSNSLYIDTNTIHTSGTNLMFNNEDVMDYDNLKNTPSAVTGGTGIQVNSGVVSLNSALSGLSDVHTTAPTDGQVLAWDNGNSRWAPAAAGGTLAMNDLTDVDTSGISTGQYLKWDGSSFVASTVSGGGASAINDLSDVDTTTSAPSNGDVLTWSASGSEWAPQAPSGGGGSGASVEYFKINYATNGNLDTITNSTSGVSATILSSTGGDVEISFSGASYPPASILIYGYAYSSNEYVIMPFNKDITTRKIDAGGSSGSPTAFGSFSSTDMTIKLREGDTGASRSFGTTTHAWIMFTLA